MKTNAVALYVSSWQYISRYIRETLTQDKKGNLHRNCEGSSFGSCVVFMTLIGGQWATGDLGTVDRILQ